MLFHTKSSSARRSLLAFLLALFFLGNALGAKIAKKAEKASPSASNTNNKADADATAAAADAKPATNEYEEDEDEDADADGDDDDEEEEQAASVDKDAAEASPTNTDKNQLQPSVDPTDLSVWGMVRTFWGWLRSDLSESLFADDEEDNEKPSVVEGRTFGKIRRLQMALIPIIFKFGVLSAMVAFLVAIGMKSLFLLKVLVVMNALAILGKFLTLKTSLFGQYENSAPSFSYSGWNPHAKESWTPTGFSGNAPSGSHGPSKEIHLHIHGNAQTQAQLAGTSYNYESQAGWTSRSDPYGAYQPSGQFGEHRGYEVPNNTDPISLLPTKYPARSLIR